MSTANVFSVFPPPRVPRISMPNPHNRKPSLKTVVSPEHLKESVVIALEEMPTLRIPQDSIQAYNHGPAVEVPGEDVAVVFKNGVPPPPPLPQQPTSSKTKTKSVQGSPDPGSFSSSETLVRGSTDDEGTSSPVVPIRSMFPVYNPSIPLSQQTYYPQRPTPAYNPKLAADAASQARSFLAASVRNSMASAANQHSLMDVPLDILTPREPVFSSPQELEKLWEATHGTEPSATTSCFDLQLSRLEEATFVLGPSPDKPFYTMTTFDTSEISITKTCPRKRSVICDVALTSIEAASRRLPPNDGLVSFIFPKMAAMLAINQSNALAEDYGLAPTDRDDIQAAAMKRAASQEASHLRWNPLGPRYELEHPAVTRRNRDPNFVMSPSSPQGEAKPVLHITVATSSQPSPDKPVIIVTYPANLRPLTTSPTTGVRSPHLEAGGDVQLATLDFNTNTLRIETNDILDLMPSLFAIDSIISAMIVVAIADTDANAAMGGMPLWVPKPSRPEISSWAGSPRSAGTGSNPFYATIAEREEAEAEARAAAKNHKKDMKKAHKPRNFTDLTEEQPDLEAGRTWYGKSKVKKQRKKKQIVIGEFDLEKLTHYQSGARQGQELPAVTRGALTVMVSALKCIVWFLSMIVQFLAWLMVNLTRGVTSEKF